MLERTALLAGATGRVGSHCLRLLLDSPRYKAVHVIARGEASKHDPKLVWQQLDFTTLEMADLPRIDDTFCTLGVRRDCWRDRAELQLAEFEYPLAIARLAKSLGAGSFATVTSVASSSNSPISYLSIKGRLERELENLRFESLNLFRPSFLLSKNSSLNLANGLLWGPLRKYRAVAAREVAEAIVWHAASQQPGCRIHHFGTPPPETG